MKQNKNNRFAALLLALCMAVCCALPALAAPAASANIDLSRACCGICAAMSCLSGRCPTILWC